MSAMMRARLMPLSDVVLFYVYTPNTVYTCPFNSLAFFISNTGCKRAASNGMTFINHQSLLKGFLLQQDPQPYSGRRGQGGKQFFQ